MNWPIIKGSYKVINPKGDIAINTRASFNLKDNPLFESQKRICIIGSCVTENIGIDRMIKNIITNGNIRSLIICGQESKGHDVGNALMNLIKYGVKDGRIIDATGHDPVLRVPIEYINRFRGQIKHILVIDSSDPQEILLTINNIPKEPSLENYVLPIQKNNFDFSNVIFADKCKYKIRLEDAYFKIYLKKNYIITEYHGKEIKKIAGKSAEEICSKILELGLVNELSHAMYLGRELKKAELCLKYSQNYYEDMPDIRKREMKPVLINADNLKDAWLKALKQVYLYGKEYFVGKYNAKTYDLPIMIHTKAIPVMHKSAPRYDSRENYVKEFLYGSEKENEFIYTYYSRLRHYTTTPAISKVKNIFNEKISGELIQFDQIKAAIDLLKKDKTLRRVVISTWMPYKDLSLERSPHAPCLVLIQPRIVDNKLDFYVVFKSQDLYSAFPSNAYALTKLQEYMAKEIGISTGNYTHFTVSMHIYDSVIDSVEELLIKEELI